MPITINNVTINNRLTIINDADVNPSNSNNGPKEYSGDTEADVIIDGTSYLNLNASDIVPDNIHALQFYPSSNSGWIEFDGNADNQDITSSEIPAWANTMITRWNGEKAYWETYQTSFDNAVANLDTDSETYTSDYANAQTSAQTAATTAKNNILGA
tara:strand:- start:865 stop:1335 length:471 start_codon:yes stop_codon:yes gene_type:complete